MFCYEAYGIGIHSAFQLPELVARDQIEPDLVIRQGAVTHRSHEGESRWDVNASGVTYYRQGVGSCQVRGGREILINACSGADQLRIRHLILNTGLGLAMHQRGHLVLHASAVSMGEQAIVFIAHSDGGKSTTSAALHSWGYGVVADDVVVIDVPKDGSVSVLPASPHLKICPRTAAFLGYADNTLTTMKPVDGRFAYYDTRTFTIEPLSAAVIYLLAAGTKESIEQLRPQAAFVELLRYTLPIVTELLEVTDSPIDYLQTCAYISNHVPVRRLTRRMDLATLDNVKRFIEADILAHPTSSDAAFPRRSTRSHLA